MATFTIEQKGVHYTILVDDADWSSWVCLKEWRVSSGGYVVTGRRPQHSLHRMIAGATDKRVLVDHVNGNRLDNRSANLRLATPQQNAQNNAPKSQYAGRQRPSAFKGVSFRRGRWRLNIKLPDGTKVDRLFLSEEDAAGEYDRLAAEHQGEFARLNFDCPAERKPDSA